MTRTIRPWQFFAALGPDRDISYRIPSEPGVVSGTVSSLDTLLLITAIRICRPKSLLELGTGLGYNAYHLCRNTDVVMTTVDKDERPAVFLPCYADRVHRIVANVADYVESLPTNGYDMIFYDVNIPGLTEYCTSHALASEPRIMAWHDYGHPAVPHVKQYLDSLDLSIIHVEDSLMAFWFRDGFEVAQ